MTDDKSIPPGKKPSAPVDDDEDRTLLMPMPPQGATANAGSDPDTDDDRTLLFQSPAAPQISAGSESGDDQGNVQDDDDDNDRTLLVVSPHPVPVNKPDADPDRTVISTAATQESEPEPERGSTYRPFSDGTSPPASAPPVVQASTMTTSISTDPTQAPPLPGPLRTLEPGAVINNMYRVEERIDHGGMGSVFRGIEIGTGESVAIKVILPEMAEDPRVAQMFRREARTLRQLHHDAIVRYFAYVPPDANFNLHALVMGFIEGTKLSDKIKTDGPLTEKQVCNLFLRLAGGLDRAHNIGIVHRDLSPDNVMLPDNDISKALLIDFGISRSSKVKDVTIGNEFAGKLKYVSPEQLGAYGGEAEGPSDVYSFALLMIVALTGKALAMGDSIVEAVQKRQSVPDLSEVPSNFQSLLYQMLQPDPAMRMKSMEEVIAQLRAIQGGDAVTLNVATQRTQNRAVAGLQAAPRANPAGEGFVTSAPTAFPVSALEQKGGGGFSKILIALALIGAVGLGGWFVLNKPDPDAGDAKATATDGDGMQRTPGTRDTFLAETLTEPCSYAALRAQGENAGLIEGFAANPATLGGIGAQFETAFGMRPDVVTRSVQEPQCAAVALARALQGTSGTAIEMALDATTVPRNEGVVGTIHDDATGRQNWLALVSPTGRVFSLMNQLAEPIGTQRRFSFRLPSAQPGTYVLIATASDAALVRAAAMVDGTAASDLLPLMMRELAQDGQGSVTISVVEITR